MTGRTRIQVLSDLHLEFSRALPFTPPLKGDVVVLAGDIANGLEGLSWAKETFCQTPVIYVAGNHEYYRHSIPGMTEELVREGRARGIHVLSENSVEVCGVRFLGTTLWTDYRLSGNFVEAAAAAERGMTDFLRISTDPGPRPLRVSDVEVLHFQARQWLAVELARPCEKTVVVTHHAPSIRCIDPQYRRNPLAPCFVSALDDLVYRSQAELWIHGHTHFSTDFRTGRTRVVSNQRGYPGEPAQGFDPGFTVEI